MSHVRPSPGGALPTDLPVRCQVSGLAVLLRSVRGASQYPSGIPVARRPLCGGVTWCVPFGTHHLPLPPRSLRVVGACSASERRPPLGLTSVTSQCPFKGRCDSQRFPSPSGCKHDDVCQTVIATTTQVPLCDHHLKWFPTRVPHPCGSSTRITTLSRHASRTRARSRLCVGPCACGPACSSSCHCASVRSLGSSISQASPAATGP